MGAITALGHSAAATWAALSEGRSGIGPIETIPTEQLNVKIAAEVHGFDPAAHIDNKKLPLLDRVSQFALVAAREAVAQSGLDFRVDGRGERSACIIGSGIGGEGTHNEQSKRFYGDKNPRVHPLTILRVMANAPACHIGIEYGLTGPTFAVVSACASANHAMSQAADMIRSGKVDFAVTGGTEACVTVTTMKAWEAMRVTADDTCRPFCKQRRGMVLGEGAGIFVFEAWEHAKARGATILAEFAGSGMTADAADMVFPSEVTVARAMQNALADAGLNPEDVGYINAHGTATPASIPKTSATSTRTARRRRPTIRPRARRSGARSARTPTHSRCRRPNRCTAMRSALPAQSSSLPRSARCGTASCRRPPTSSTLIRLATSTTCQTSRARRR